MIDEPANNSANRPNPGQTVITNIAQIRARIAVAEKNSKRIPSVAPGPDDVTPGIVQLLAVSKTRSADEIRQAYQAGIENIGENYLQEALDKQQQLADLPLTWHFIGPIQSNKTAAIASHFSWVHSLDRLKIARRLNDQRPPELPPLNICIQVNVGAESTKSGVDPKQVPELANGLVPFKNLRLRGLMAIPAPNRPEAALRQDFAALRNLLIQLNSTGFQLDTLSMGMSNDLECAIAEGATMVRVGTGIFGPRSTKNADPAD